MVRILIVRDLAQKRREDNAYVRDVLSGKRRALPAERTIVITPELFAKIFSPKRLTLLLELKRSRRNIYQTAKALGRSYEAVHRDLTLLEGFGLVKIRTQDRKRYPTLETIHFPVLEA